MGFLDRFSRGERRPSIKNSLFRLTETGREKLQTFSGNTDSRILVVLETDGSLNLDEISSRANVSKGKLENLLPLMVRQGLISTAGAGGNLE